MPAMSSRSSFAERSVMVEKNSERISSGAPFSASAICRLSA